jgi:SlyX protein
MSEERFVDLEMRVAHQDQMLHELNEVVTDQQSKIMRLEELCRSLIDRVRSLGEGLPAGDPTDERPPHY